MAKMNSKFKYMFDAAPSITLEAQSAPARTADGDTTAIALDKLDGYWTNGELADQTFAVAVNVLSLDTTTGDETYALNLVFGEGAGFTGAVTTHSLRVAGPGQYVFLVDIDTVRAMLANADHMRIAVDVGGTTPSIDFYAWIAGAIIR